MGVNYFTNKQVKELQGNKYVKHVSNKAITYTEECKQQLYEYSLQGLKAKESFIKLGFNPLILGKRRMQSLVERTEIQAKRLDGFKDTRKVNSGRPQILNMSTEELLKYKNHQILLLTQENIALKKNDLIERQALQHYPKKQKDKNSK
ncbi:MAG: HTH domain-containing protein [Bacilli bacterium]